MATRHTYGGHALFVLIIGALATANAQKRPPNYSQDDMPVTNFNCREKIVGGYYADPETDCQMFHVCVHLPGVGIQDFRFLCPNDTAFDQEHQICDDWYNIDCELSSTYYSDSFDLYRIGANNEVKKPLISHKGTPIPLGPSTTIKPWTQSKKSQYLDEDDYKNNGNDILRGSHSSNFFSSKNRGREDLDDSDEDTPNVGAQRQELHHPNEIRKQKTLVRKVTNKRPVTQPPTTTSATFAPSNTNQYNTNYNNYNNNNQNNQNNQNNLNNQNNQNNQNSKPYNPNTQQYQYTGNKVTKSRGNVNYNTYTIKATKPPTTTTSAPNIYLRINNLTESTYEQDVSQESPVTQVYDLNKTYKNSQNFRQQQQSIPAYSTPKYNTVAKNTFPSTPSAATVVTQTESFRLPSTEYLQNIAQSYQQPATVINNQLQDVNSNAYSQPPQFDIYKKVPSSSTGTKSTFANYDNYQQQQQQQPQYNTYKQPSSYPSTVNVPQTSAAAQNTYYDTRSQSTDTYTYQSYTTQPTTYVQSNTTVFDYYKYYQTSTPAATVTQKARAFYTAAPTFNYYQQQPSTTTPPKYDPYATFQKANEKYDDEEFLKTAPSSNLKPSDLNAIHNLKKQSYVNATLKAAYSVEQPKQPYNVQSSATVPSSTAKITNPPKAAINYNTVNTGKLTTQYKTPSSAAAQQTYSAKPATKANATSSNSHDYDYAYYDNAGSSEYDQLETVEEDFARIQRVQKT